MPITLGISDFAAIATESEWDSLDGDGDQCE